MYNLSLGSRRPLPLHYGYSPPNKRARFVQSDNQPSASHEVRGETLNEDHFDSAFSGFGDLDFSQLQPGRKNSGADGLNDIVVIRRPIDEADRAKPKPRPSAKKVQPVNETIVLSDYSDSEDSNDIEIVSPPLTAKEKAAVFFGNAPARRTSKRKAKKLDLTKPLMFSQKKKVDIDDEVLILPSPKKSSVISPKNSSTMFLNNSAARALGAPWHIEKPVIQARKSARLAEKAAAQPQVLPNAKIMTNSKKVTPSISVPNIPPIPKNSPKKSVKTKTETNTTNSQNGASQEPMEIDMKQKEEAMDVDLVANAENGTKKSESDVVAIQEGSKTVKQTLGVEGRLRLKMNPVVRLYKMKPLTSHGVPLSICTYNVLCESTRLRCEYLYKSCDKMCLPWSIRWRKLCKFFRENYADIYCLQEVEEKYVKSHYSSFFGERNYRYVYIPRGNGNPDGCMIAYNARELKRIEGDHEQISYNYKVEGFNKDNVALLLRFEHIQSGLRFNVVNTHILFNMKRGDLKLGQLIILLSNVMANTNDADPNFVGNILCGDFNMDPHSLLYSFVRHGNIKVGQRHSHQLALHENKWQNEPKNKVDVKPSRIGLNYRCKPVNQNGFVNEQSTYSHDLKFLSVYDHKTETGHPEISTRHDDFGCPDFIFYQAKAGPNQQPQEGRIQISRRLRLPSLKEIDLSVGPMPNRECGSDHLPLLAEFIIS